MGTGSSVGKRKGGEEIRGGKGEGKGGRGGERDGQQEKEEEVDK